MSTLVCMGCGPRTPAVAPVEGKVLLDGRPLNTGRVLSIPAAGRGANGLIRSDGTFELQTFGEHDGAIVGKHKIAVVAYQGTYRGPEGGEGKLLVPEHYANPETSGLTIEVDADGRDNVVLELTTAEEKKEKQ